MNKQQKVKHLYNRAGFGISPNLLQQKSQAPLVQVIKKMLKEAKEIKPLKVSYYKTLTAEEFKNISPQAKRKERQKLRKKVKEVNANWLRQMIDEKSNPLQEKMTLFWHGHFACESKRFDYALQQINNIRKYALGNFRDLVVMIAKDPAMILYLNNQQNKKKNPNENFARELMELFTIGRGHYTEKDVSESARAFTGWSIDRLTGKFEVKERQHDSQKKTFMGRTGNFDGEDIIDIILEKKETAHYITTKIYRYFVNQKVDKKQVAKLANLFYNSNYNIATLMQSIFESDWFYEPQNIGSKIKSPVELLVGMSKTLGIKFEDNNTIFFIQKALGQTLFAPPNVAGWPGGKTWIDNATLLLRLNLTALAFDAADMTIEFKNEPEMPKGQKMAKLKITTNLNSLEALFQNTEKAANDLVFHLLPTSFDIKKTIVEQWGNAASPNDKIKAYLLAIMSLPEYQMC